MSSSAPMQLLYTAFSPFSRKVRLVAHELGISDRITLVPTEVGTHVPLATDTHTALAMVTPLMKIPVLTLPDDVVLFDSRVICEYLDSTYGRGILFPTAIAARYEALMLQSLADGIVDALLLCRFESTRAEAQRSDEWHTAQLRRVTQALDFLEARGLALPGYPTIGTISIACALGYLDFRFTTLQWRATRPRLAGWFDPMSLSEAMQSTSPFLHGV
jgi:glutathione S-transferase